MQKRLKVCLGKYLEMWEEKKKLKCVLRFCTVHNLVISMICLLKLSTLVQVEDLYENSTLFYFVFNISSAGTGHLRRGMIIKERILTQFILILAAIIRVNIKFEVLWDAF